MTDVSALDKHLCPACGAEAVWTPAQQALVCPYCGTTSPAELAADGSVIKEHDLATALRALPQEQRGFANDRTAVQCQSCKAISLFEATRVAQRCDFCGSAAIVPYDKTRNAIRPESLLPFALAEGQVREAMRQWYGSRWFAPNRLKGAALTDRVHGIYVPYWTFDAAVHARWTATAGYHYYETQTVQRNGRTEQVRVQRTRWEPASGEVDMAFDDELVPATLGVKAHLLKGIEPFPTRDLRPYDPGYVSGWVVEQYQIDLVAAAEHARDAMTAKLRARCAADIPGDTYRDLEVFPTWDRQTFKHILAPVWVLSYDYGRRAFQVLVNGVTGQTAGEQPYSWIKIALAVLAVIVVVLILVSLQD